MSITQLNEQLYIASQLTTTDIAHAAELGIQSVICNRPDGEEADQPTFADIQAQLTQAGINHSHHQPVVAPNITPEDVQQFQQLLANTPSPVLAYCRTGTRSLLLWTYHQMQHGLSLEQALATAQQIGLDINNFTPRLAQFAQHQTTN